MKRKSNKKQPGTLEEVKINLDFLKYNLNLATLSKFQREPFPEDICLHGRSLQWTSLLFSVVGLLSRGPIGLHAV
jgi:hypothetical protein